jgi:hypothetical protein
MKSTSFAVDRTSVLPTLLTYLPVRLNPKLLPSRLGLKFRHLLSKPKSIGSTISFLVGDPAYSSLAEAVSPGEFFTKPFSTKLV